MTERPSWIRTAGVVAVLAGLVRLFLSVGASFLGTSLSCGTPLAFLLGQDKGHPVALSICSTALHNASAEALLLIVGGFVAAWATRPHKGEGPRRDSYF